MIAMEQQIIYPGEVSSVESLTSGMLVYGLSIREWRLMRIKRIARSVAICIDEETGKQKQPRVPYHVRMVHKTTFERHQHRALEKLWFIYGNNGQKHTDANHHFIQHLLELPYVDLQSEFRIWSKRCTSECREAVEKVLGLQWYSSILLEEDTK
jgi:hypothetical protein